MFSKKNVNPSPNAKFNKLLCETVLQNMLLLCNSNKALLRATRSILYRNHDSAIGIQSDVYYLVKLLIKKFVIYEKLGSGDNETDLPNLFANSSMTLAKKVLLTEYKNSFWGKWGIADYRLERANNKNDITIRNNNVNIVDRQEREIEIDYK